MLGVFSEDSTASLFFSFPPIEMLKGRVEINKTACNCLLCHYGLIAHRDLISAEINIFFDRNLIFF